MRDLKFRMWDGKKMTSDIFLCTSDNDLNEVLKDIKLMQYTGLKDKNGKPIYEGDVLERYMRKGKAYKTLKNVDDIRTCYTSCKFAEESAIIGNIYESPELLNK